MRSHRHRTETRGSSLITPEELTELLHRLHSEDATRDIVDDQVTVAAVCEATDESQERVWLLLEEIRRDDIESRLAEKLREAEEPLFRVERPGFTSDPLSKPTWSNRQRAFSSILDHLPRPQRPKKTKVAKTIADTSADRQARALAFILLLLMLGLITTIIVFSLAQQFG